jgi:hypothetical protein
MRRQSGKLWTALAAAVGMVATAAWTAITTTGWPPVIPTDVPWNFILFSVFAFIAFFALLRENLGLTTPHLDLVYDPDNGPPYVFDKLGADGKTLRIHRVGVRNVGATADDVSVKLAKCAPAEPGTVYPGHELQPMGHELDTLSIKVHRSGSKYDEPLVFFDVIGQLFNPGQPSDRLHIRYAAKGLYSRFLAGERYELTLAIHGQGASDPMKFVVERDADGCQWILRRVHR